MVLRLGAPNKPFERCLGPAPADPDAIWVTEVWDSADSHKASLSLPSVKQTIARGKPLIAAFEQHFETRPVGGHGLVAG